MKLLEIETDDIEFVYYLMEIFIEKLKQYNNIIKDSLLDIYISIVLKNNVTRQDIINEVDDGYIFRQFDNMYVVMIDPDATIRGNKLIECCKLLEYGAFEINGIHLFDKCTKYIYNNLQLLNNVYYVGKGLQNVS